MPYAVREDADGRVTSFWIDGQPLLLQVSSYLRAEGQLTSARSRLSQRIQTHSESWRTRDERIHPDSLLDQAAAEYLDEIGALWIHAYLVWPHLTVYALVSGPAHEVGDSGSWARRAVASIRLAVH